MGQLSDKEMLLLANYVYMDVSLTEGTIGDTLDSLKGSDGSFDKDRLSDAGGGMTPEQAKDLLTIMDSIFCAVSMITLTTIIRDVPANDKEVWKIPDTIIGTAAIIHIPTAPINTRYFRIFLM